MRPEVRKPCSSKKLRILKAVGTESDLPLGFVQTDEKLMEEWGKSSTEIRFDLDLRTDDRADCRSRYAD